jgi:hypothetical protein
MYIHGQLLLPNAIRPGSMCGGRSTFLHCWWENCSGCLLRLYEVTMWGTLVKGEVAYSGKGLLLTYKSWLSLTVEKGLPLYSDPRGHLVMKDVPAWLERQHLSGVVYSLCWWIHQKEFLTFANDPLVNFPGGRESQRRTSKQQSHTKPSSESLIREDTHY